MAAHAGSTSALTCCAWTIPPAATMHEGGMNDQINNIADWRVTLDGNDLTDRLRPRLVSLSLSEKRGDEADQLDIVLDDSDGMLAIPTEGAVLRVQLGRSEERRGGKECVRTCRFRLSADKEK